MAKKSRDNVLIPKATTSATYKSKVANYQPTNNAVTNKSSFENKLLPVKKTTPLNNFEPLINQQQKSTEKKSLTLPSALTNVTCSLGPTDGLTIQSDKCVTVIVNENITEQKYIKNISGAESICVGTVDSSNNFTTVVNDVSRIGFDTNSGLNVVCLESGLSKIYSTNVYSINSLNGNVTLSAGNNISIGTSGNTLTISNSGAGISGFSGFSGTSGVSGYSGISGVSGYSGVDGFGISGYSGTSGYSGVGGPGTSGFSGYSGVGGPGTSGFSGYSGVGGTGTSGYSGISGYSGVGGPGVSGYSGFSGANGSGGISTGKAIAMAIVFGG